MDETSIRTALRDHALKLLAHLDSQNGDVATMVEQVRQTAAMLAPARLDETPDIEKFRAVAAMALSPSRDAYDRYDGWHERLATAAREALGRSFERYIGDVESTTEMCALKPRPGDWCMVGKTAFTFVGPDPKLLISWRNLDKP